MSGRNAATPDEGAPMPVAIGDLQGCHEPLQQGYLG